MYPKLLEIGPFTLPTYGVLVVAGVLVGLYVATRLGAREGLKKENVYNLGVYLALAGILGSKLFLVLQEWDYYLAHPAALLSTSLLQSGGIFYGGLIFAVAAGLWYTHHHHMGFLKTADAFAPGAAIGHSFGRLGCFSAGCCWGKATTMPWGVTFTNTYSNAVVGVPLGIPLHPTQLYEWGALLIIAAILYRRFLSKQFDGQVLGWYLLLYGIARFIIEFFRSHSPEAQLWGGEELLFGGPLSAAQGISILLILAAVWILWLGPYRRQHAAPLMAAAARHASR